MSLMSVIDVSSSGLRAEKFRIEIIAENMANIDTTKTSSGGPYRRKMVVFKEVLQDEIQNADGNIRAGMGVEVEKVVEDTKPPLMVYDPAHPHADQDGYVAKPDINLANEMVDLITASRAYGANVTVLNDTKSLILKTLNIGKE